MKDENKATSEDLDLLIKYHPNPMALSDLNGKILAINDKLAKIFKKSKEELIGTHGFDNIESEAAEQRRKIIEKVIETKKPMEHIDLERGRWWRAIFQPILDNKGSVVKLAYYIQDITEEKKSINFFEYLSDQSLLGICIIKRKKIVYINDALEKITGFRKDEFLNKGVNLIIDIIHPDDREFVIKQLEKKLSGDVDVINRYTFRLISQTGNIKWLEIYSKTINYEKENADFITLIDVTEVKLKEEKLKDTEEKWSSLVNNLPITDRISIIDRSYKIEYLNRSYPGRNINQLIGKKIDSNRTYRNNTYNP